MSETAATCPHCHAPVGPGTRFCGNCGKSVTTSEAPAKAAARTMMGLDASAIKAATDQAKTATSAKSAEAAPAPKQMFKTMMGVSPLELGSAATVAAPAIQPPAAAPIAATSPASASAGSEGNKKLAARTMIGSAAMLAPPPEPTPAAAPSAQASAAVPSNRTMIGSAAAYVPPSAASGSRAEAAATEASQRALAGQGRTMLGVPLSSTSDRPPTASASPAAGATDPNLWDDHPTTDPPPAMDRAGTSSNPARPHIDTLSVPRKPVNPMLIAGLVLGLGLIVGAGFLMMRGGAGKAARGDVSVKTVSIDTGEALLFEMPSAPAGSKVRFGGQEKPLQAGRASFALAADSLRVGDNVVLADIIFPDGQSEPQRITLSIDHRITVDTSPLRSDRAAIDVVVNALPGTRVTLDGQELKLDSEGRGTRSYPIDVVAEAKSGMIEQVVHYRVQPPTGETVVDELHTQIPVAAMQIDRPGRELVTDRESIEIAGGVGKDTQVTVDGMPASVKDGRFLYRLSLPTAKVYQPRIVASALGKAPFGITLQIKRVDNLAAAASEFRVDSDLTYAKLAPNPSIYRGQKIAIEGRVYATDAHAGESVIQMFARPCPSSQRCSTWVTDPSGSEVAVDTWVRVLGVVEGEQQFRSEKNEIVTVPKIKASFVLPAKP